ncbi:MAG: hypothetical protein HQL26_09280 [Candidatus Omnitrophica bacterium]|nr:hypothetical protein [Candidatus Omnitrophota bacterium]
MKKNLGIALMMVLVLGVAMPSWAAKSGSKNKAEQKYDRIVAEVVSIDTTANTIVVKEEKTGESRTIKISAKAAAEIKVGDRVRIKLKVGTNESAGVRVLKGEQPKVETAVEPSVESKGIPAAGAEKK